jgi:hypothetical protein
MTQQAAPNEARRRAARDAWAALPHGGHDAVRLQVQCGRSHHVATVYDTGDGFVIVTRVRARSHGSRDRVDEPHGDQAVAQWIDFLATADPTSDDAVPAWCDCGHRTLSRADMQGWITAGERRVIVD